MMLNSRKIIHVTTAVLLVALSHYSYGQQIPPACTRLLKPYELCLRDYVEAAVQAFPEKNVRSEINPKQLEIGMKAAIKREGIQVIAGQCATEQKKNEILHSMVELETVIALVGGDPQRCGQEIQKVRRYDY
jgi:hypothetical protein